MIECLPKHQQKSITFSKRSQEKQREIQNVCPLLGKGQSSFWNIGKLQITFPKQYIHYRCIWLVNLTRRMEYHKKSMEQRTKFYNNKERGKHEVKKESSWTEEEYKKNFFISFLYLLYRTTGCVNLSKSMTPKTTFFSFFRLQVVLSQPFLS